MYLAHHTELCRTTSILELGAGAGLSGLVAAKLSDGPSKVVLTDYNPLVIDLMKKNAPKVSDITTTDPGGGAILKFVVNWAKKCRLLVCR